MPAAAVLPPELRGVWRRVSIALAGASPREEQSVVWLQGPRAFADVRLPLGRSGTATATSFAGTTSYEPPRLTWRRDVDLDTSAHADVGTVTWEGGDLIERGTFPFFGAPVAYVEVWRKESTRGPTLALEAPGARLVRVGGHAATVIDDRPSGGAFSACHWTLGPSGWDVVNGFGPAFQLLPTPPPGEAWEAGDEVVLGRRRSGGRSSWIVLEAGLHQDQLPTTNTTEAAP